MKACARHLAAGKQACNVGLTQQACLHAATHVVLGRHDRDWLLSDVNAALLALCCNVWEVLQNLQCIKQAISTAALANAGVSKWQENSAAEFSWVSSKQCECMLWNNNDMRDTLYQQQMTQAGMHHRHFTLPQAEVIPHSVQW